MMAEHAFKEIDVNGNGALSVDEVAKAAAKANSKQGSTAPRSRMQYLVEKFSTKGGRLSLEEFKSMISYLCHGNAVADELVDAWMQVEEIRLENTALMRTSYRSSSVTFADIKPDKGVTSADIKPDKEPTTPTTEDLRAQLSKCQDKLSKSEAKLSKSQAKVAGLEAELSRSKASPRPAKSKPPAVVQRMDLSSLVKKAQKAQQKAQKAQEASKELQEVGSNERRSKFTAFNFTSAVGHSAFDGGLEARIGAPSPNLHIAMWSEHCNGADSQSEFTTGNYGVTTTPEIEWYFVLDPGGGLKKLKLLSYPVETHDCEHRRAAQLMPLKAFLPELEKKNELLKALGGLELLEEELLAARLYTGPMVSAPDEGLESAHLFDAPGCSLSVAVREVQPRLRNVHP